MESPREAYKARAEAQESCIRRFMAATGYGPEEWAAKGYAEAFSKAWDKDRMRHIDAIYSVVLATASKVRTILTNPKDDARPPVRR